MNPQAHRLANPPIPLPPAQKNPHPSSGIFTGALLVTTGAPCAGPWGHAGGVGDRSLSLQPSPGSLWSSPRRLGPPPPRLGSPRPADG